MENIPDTPEGIILESLLEGMNQYYSAELSQKVKRGMRETRLKGNFQGGGLPYGYRIENRKVVIDETKAEVVRYMYEQYSKGVYVRDIISALTAKGILYKGKPFARNTVYGILQNEKYSGIYRHGDEVYENIYPRLLPQDLYESVRRKVESNKFGKRSVKTVYLLRNKVRCGYCGKPISAETGTARNGEIKRYYKCIGRKKYQNGCQKTQVPKEFLENFILNAIIEEMSKPQILDNIVSSLLRQRDKLIAESSLLKVLTSEKTKVENALNNLVNAIEQGIISNTTNKRLHELERQQEDLERQILIERSRQSVRLSEAEIREYYEKALRLEPQMLINYLVKEIILFNDRVEIHFNSPLKASPDESRDFTLCSYFGALDYRKQNNPIIQKKQMKIVIYIG